MREQPLHLDYEREIKELRELNARHVEANRELATMLGKCIVERMRLRELNAELLAACKALQMEARARNCGLRIADEAIAKAEKLK